jgi:hypothetical protein
VRAVAFASLIALVAALLVTPAAVGSTPVIATVVLSSNAAGASAVSMTISLRTELQCGRLMGGPVVATFPRRVRVPGTIVATAVLVGTRASRSVSVAGHAVSVAMPLPRGVMCDSIAPGVAKITFSRAAGLGNPKSPGVYVLKLRRGSETFAALFRIH